MIPTNCASELFAILWNIRFALERGEVSAVIRNKVGTAKLNNATFRSDIEMVFKRRQLISCQPDSAYEQFLTSRVDKVANKFAKAVWNGEYEDPLRGC